VQDNKDFETTSCADPPWLVALAPVVGVDGEDCNDICSCDGDRHLDVEGAVEDVEVDGEGRLPSGLVGRRRESSW